MADTNIDFGEYKLKPEELRRFVPTEEISGRFSPPEVPIEFVGQKRAQKALDFLLSSGINLHGVVVVESGRLFDPRVLKTEIRRKVKKRKGKGEIFTLKDWTYNYNFTDPSKPIYLDFPAGQGEDFKNDVEGLWNIIESTVKRIFTGRKYAEKMAKILKKIREEEAKEFKKLFEKFERERNISQVFKERGWQIVFSEEENVNLFYWGPADENGTVINDLKETKKRLDELPPEKRKAHIKDCQEMAEMIKKIESRLKIKLDNLLDELEYELFERAVEPIFSELIQPYRQLPKVIQFITALKNKVVEKYDFFFTLAEQESKPGSNISIPNEITEELEDLYLCFQVNLLVNNKGKECPPVLIELAPTYADLFGRIERQILAPGGIRVKTNHMMIKPGAFHIGQDGFVILDFTDIILSHKHEVFFGLKRNIKENLVKIQDSVEEFGGSVVGERLSPEPMPLELKVIIVVDPRLYYTIWQLWEEEEFIRAFPVKIDFDTAIEYNLFNIQAYAAWMDIYTKKKQYPALEPGAKAKIIEFLLKEAGSQERWTWDIEKMKNLIKEATAYVKNSETIKAEDITRAIKEKIYRVSLIQEKIINLIKGGQIKFSLEGKEVGQMKGYEILPLGDYSFGIPVTITANLWRGKKGIIDIDRQVKYTEESHHKGEEILTSVLYRRYYKETPLNIDGKICFEDSFERRAGPSASMAELCAVISELSGYPIDQSFLMTGTIGQKEWMGIIGGVTEKLEGPYQICKYISESEAEKKEIPTMNAIIPLGNKKDLMLDEELVELARKGKFNVFAVDILEKAAEMVMKQPIANIDNACRLKIRKWSIKN